MIVLARRFCGAALDMRRPWRLFRFAVFAAVPAVLISTLLAGAVAVLMSWKVPGTLAFRMHHLFDMELLAMMIVTPTLLLVARSHRFRSDAQARPAEFVLLMVLVTAAVVWAFGQNQAPILFMILPPLILLAFRLSPPWTAGAVLWVTVIAVGATVLIKAPSARARVAAFARRIPSRGGRSNRR